MLTNIGLFSYGAALLAFALLTVLAFFSKRGSLGVPILVGCAATALWAGVTVSSTLASYPQVRLMQLAEVARNASWIFLLLKFLGSRLEGSEHILATKRWIPWFCLGFAAAITALLGQGSVAVSLSLPEKLPDNIVFAAWLAMATLVLLLLEQIYRNSTEAERWSIKYLCLGIGVVFAYDFFMYAEALLFHKLDAELWQARGITPASPR